jgi:hypothetical protein
VWSPVDQLTVAPYYHMTYSYYPHYADTDPTLSFVDNEDRSDFTNTVGLTTTYQINQYLSANIGVSWEKRLTTYSNPNDPTYSNVPEYSQFNAGCGGGLTFQF